MNASQDSGKSTRGRFDKGPNLWGKISRMSSRAVAAFSVFLGLCFLLLAWALPSATAIQAIGRTAGTTMQKATVEIGLIRKSLNGLASPECVESLRLSQSRLREIEIALKQAPLDYENISRLAAAMGDAASALEATAKTVDDESVAQLGGVLAATADILDKEIEPRVSQAHDVLVTQRKILKAALEGTQQVVDDGVAANIMDNIRGVIKSLAAFEGGG